MLLPVIAVLVCLQQFLMPIPWVTFLLVGILPMALVNGLTLWIWFTTGYTVTETHLIVRSAFVVYRIPLADIRRVKPTRNPLSSPALSLNRLEIRTGKGLGPLISPQRRDEFLQLLRERCPQAEIMER